MKHYVTLWEYCLSQRGQSCRFTASRILNYLCKKKYKNVWITKANKEEIKKQFKINENVLYRWSVNSPYVDYIVMKLLVDSENLKNFLQQNGFNVNTTYNPDRNMRKDWIFNTIQVIEGTSTETDTVKPSKLNLSSTARRNTSKDEKGRDYVLSDTGVRVFVDFRDNLIIDKDDPAVIAQGNNFKYTRGIVWGLSKIGSENSEDAMTWNTFRTLSKIHPPQWFPVLFPGIKLKDREYDELKIHFWQEVPPPPKRPVREGNTQVDLILETSETIIFIEVKYRSEISLSTTYDPERDQIIRNVDVGSYVAKEKGKNFYFLLLLPSSNDISIQTLTGYRNNPSLVKEKIGDYRDDIKDFNSLAKHMSSLYWEDILKLLKNKDFQQKGGIDLNELIEWLKKKF